MRGLYPLKHSGLNEMTVGKICRPAPAAHQPGAVGLPKSDVLQAALVLRFIGHGAHGGLHVCGRPGPVALPEQFHQRFNEAVVKTLVHQQSAGRAAGLSAPGEVHAAHSAIDHGVKVGVRVDDHGIFTAEFEQTLLHTLRGGAGHGLAGNYAANQADSRHAGMRRQCGPHLAAPYDPIEHARREHPVQQVH